MLVVLVGLFIVSLSSEQLASNVTIRAYNANGDMDIGRDAVILGTRVLLTCNVTRLSEGNEALSYRWYHNCREDPNRRCEIRDGDPYYRVVSDTLLMDVTSLDQGGRYYCTVCYLNETQTAITPKLSMAGNPALFLYTPTSLLPEYSVLTDVQQATGRNGQQWITCRSGGQENRPQIWMGSELVANSSTGNSVTIGLGTQRPNGLYHCLSDHSGRKYFSIFLRKPVTLSTPNVISENITWTLTSPDGSRVKRYIVELECRVQNITIVEKYMNVSASGGTGQVVTSVSCFGGLGQLHGVKVWAVSGPNISPALVCATDGQCMEEAHVNTDKLTPGELLTVGTFIGVVVGSNMFLLLTLSILVVIILVVVAATVKRRATCKQMRDVAMRRNPCYNTVVRQLEMEIKEKDADAPCECADGNESTCKVSGEEDAAPFPVTDDVHQYEVVDIELHSKSTKTPAPEESSTPASASNVPAIYAVVDKSKKNGTKQTADGSTVIKKEEMYAMPIEKKGKVTAKSEDMIGSGGAEEGQQYDDTVEYKPKVDSKP